MNHMESCTGQAVNSALEGIARMAYIRFRLVIIDDSIHEMRRIEGRHEGGREKWEMESLDGLVLFIRYLWCGDETVAFCTRYALILASACVS
jgi:hypothetical protein